MDQHPTRHNTVYHRNTRFINTQQFITHNNGTSQLTKHKTWLTFCQWWWWYALNTYTHIEREKWTARYNVEAEAHICQPYQFYPMQQTTFTSSCKQMVFAYGRDTFCFTSNEFIMPNECSLNLLPAFYSVWKHLMATGKERRTNQKLLITCHFPLNWELQAVHFVQHTQEITTKTANMTLETNDKP